MAPLPKTRLGALTRGSTMRHYPDSALGFGRCPEKNNVVATEAGCDPVF